MANIKINTLYSLENVNDRYELRDDNLVVNTDTGAVKIPYLNSKGYPVVSLAKTENGKHVNRDVFMHKIIALARINNGPYKVIEHLDDNPTNNSVENLKFSDQRSNALNAFKTGRRQLIQDEFVVATDDNRIIRGPMREIASHIGVSRMTMYDIYYRRSRAGHSVPVRGHVIDVDKVK